MGQLNVLKDQLDQLKTQRAVEQNKMEEAVATLKTEYGVEMKDAQTEHDTLTKTTIPQLVLKRDNMLKKAEGILNGIDTGSAGGAGAGESQGFAGPGNQRGNPKNRQLVGRNRGD